MKPNGGKSHFTPISQCLRLLTADGSGGSLGFAGFGFCFGSGTGAAVRMNFPPGVAAPSPVNTAAASSSEAAATAIRLI